MPQLLTNPMAAFGAYSADESNIIAADASPQVAVTLGLCPKQSVTPLRDLSELAISLRVASVMLKDASGRFDLGSFKALGAPYALAQALTRRFGDAEALHTRIGKNMGQERTAHHHLLCIR